MKEVYRFVRGIRESYIERDAPDLAQLRPVIKDDRFLTDMGWATEHKVVPLARRLVADISVCCVWDSPNGMRFTIDDEPAKYGMSAEEFHARALSNYLETRPAPEVLEDGPIIVARTNDAYDASLLLVDSFWTDVATRVPGAVLACVPSRDVLLIAGSEAPGAVDALRDAAQRVSAGGHHLISETILARRGAGWEAFVTESRPADSSELRSRVRIIDRPKKPWWKFW